MHVIPKTKIIFDVAGREASLRVRAARRSYRNAVRLPAGCGKPDSPISSPCSPACCAGHHLSACHTSGQDPDQPRSDEPLHLVAHHNELQLP